MNPTPNDMRFHIARDPGYRRPLGACLMRPLAIHSDKAAWRDRWGADHEYLPVVADMLAGEWNP